VEIDVVLGSSVWVPQRIIKEKTENNKTLSSRRLLVKIHGGEPWHPENSPYELAWAVHVTPDASLSGNSLR
jgi:hypothetical protein